MKHMSILLIRLLVWHCCLVILENTAVRIICTGDTLLVLYYQNVQRYTASSDYSQKQNVKITHCHVYHKFLYLKWIFLKHHVVFWPFNWVISLNSCWDSITMKRSSNERLMSHHLSCWRLFWIRNPFLDVIKLSMMN